MENTAKNLRQEQDAIISSFLARRQEQLNLKLPGDYTSWYQLEVECNRLIAEFAQKERFIRQSIN